MLNMQNLLQAQDAHERFVRDKMKYKKYQQGAVWTLNECKQDALNYTSKKEWREGNFSAYNKACYNGWLAQCCGHMTNTNSRKKKPELTYEEVAEKANLAVSYKDFRENYEKYYIWALRNKMAPHFKKMITTRQQSAA